MQALYGLTDRNYEKTVRIAILQLLEYYPMAVMLILNLRMI
jgi:hypothetical protein